ncbi:hypothetical protein IAR55_005680 [Kwoniella newhampshirensis]|uniref:Nucleotide-diphospho-sugar transferase domain-containing protein n=1 Tax=Kwoniella newhampshirensis TaxID=1651941 RepID=A0AAW0YH24_9TREE
MLAAASNFARGSSRLTIAIVGIVFVFLLSIHPHSSVSSRLPLPFSSSNHAVVPGEPVVFSLICWGNDTAHETAVMMKTALMYTSSPLDFHILVDTGSQKHLDNLLQLIPKPVYDVRVYYYLLSDAAMNARVKRTAIGKEGFPQWGQIGQNHQSGIGESWALCRSIDAFLFLHEIISPSVTRAIFVDSDAFFITDPTLLWREFNTWNSSHVISIPSHENMDERWQGITKICSCVMLLDLQRMRNVLYMDSNLFSPMERRRALSHPANLAYWGEPTTKDGVYNNVGLGDQSFFLSVKLYKPEYHIRLPLSWEGAYNVNQIGSSEMDAETQIKQQRMLPDAEKDTLITPGVLHWNCMQAATYMDSPYWANPESEPETRWGHAMRYHHKYKWIWLNRGDGSATTESFTIQDLRFWDEKRAGRTIAEGYPTAQ